jgi:hypothetical protein
VKKAFFFVFLAGMVVLHAAGWRESKSFILKKDEFAKVMVKSAEQERLLSFRWTLYTDKALVVHENFDRIVGQHILYLGHNQSFSKRFLPAQYSERDVPYAVVVFKKFDEANQSAQFDLLLFDKENRVKLDYLTK